MEASVSNITTARSDLIKRGRFGITITMKGWSTSRGFAAAAPICAPGVQEGEQEDDDGVVPCHPVAVVELDVVGYRGLGVVVSDLEGETGVAAAARVCEWEGAEGGIVFHVAVRVTAC